MRMDNMSSDLHAFLRSRRTIRHFKPGRVSSDIIQRILETAIWAPSAHNQQPWRFVVLTTEEAKLHLAEAIAAKHRKDMIRDGFPDANLQARIQNTICRATEAPVIIVLCLDRKQVKPQPDRVRRQAEMLLSVQSVALAGLQILLAAHAEGLGGNWICWPIFAPKETQAALGLASDFDPQAMLFLGYPAETPEIPARLSVDDVTHYI
jgi:coenzyme F420-0:L-glutamate ligase/coenzyme F420-1:gamma-L-glutamate ligase